MRVAEARRRKRLRRHMRAVLRAEDGNLYPDGERPNAPGAPRERRRFAWGLRHAARAVRRWYLADASP